LLGLIIKGREAENARALLILDGMIPWQFWTVQQFVTSATTFPFSVDASKTRHSNASKCAYPAGQPSRSGQTTVVHCG